MLLALFVYATVVIFSSASSASDNLIRRKRSDDFIPCENGWYYFDDKCYKIGGRVRSDRFNWEKAAGRCKSAGGDLVTIQSKEEQDFIVTFLLLDVKFYAWIGLHDRDTEGRYKWNDGSVVNYTNWAKHEPAGLRAEREDCGQVLFEPEKDLVGKWNDNLCEFEDAYICEMNINTKRKSPNRMYCSSEEGGGWRYQDSCYHVVTEMKSWENAEQHCKANYNGHLVTILDTTVDIFLDFILSNIRKELWIGIKVQNQRQQKWTSGWFVAYDGFNKDLNLVEGTCILRKKRREWVTSQCSKRFSFICETSKVIPPVLKSPVRGSHCPQDLDDWIDLGGENCYYIEKDKALNWYEASFYCKRRGGNLASIHSKEESDILHPFVRYTQQRSYPEQTVFIGLYRRLANEEEFAWSDGSAIDYVNWRYEEPNNVVEKCVELSTHDMLWNDCNCEYKRGYICSIKKIPANSTVQETVEPTVAPNSTDVEKTAHYAGTSNSTAVEETANYAGFVSVNVLIIVSVCFLLVTILLGVVAYCCRRSSVEDRKHSAAVSKAPPPFPPRNVPRYSTGIELTVKDDEL